MLPRPLDTTIAHKAINLMPELSGTEKRIAAAIIDHFNRKTGQCDPGFKRIAWLLGLSRRTVIRAVSQIERTGILLKVRHGGHLQRNSYAPVWARFRELEAAWNARFNTNRARPSHAKMSPGQCQVSPLPGDEIVTQTLLTNHLNETFPNKPDFSKAEGSCETTNRKRHSGRQMFKSNQTKQFESGKSAQASGEAARTAAERRWNDALTDCFVGTPMYAEIIASIDAAIVEAATHVEMHKPGTGLSCVLNYLRLRKAESGSAPNEKASAAEENTSGEAKRPTCR